MAEAVISENEVSINGVRYPIVGSVQRGLSSNYPQKLVTGDYTKDSSPILSTLALSDHRGGIGLDVMEGQGDTDSSWYSTADVRFARRLFLPPLVTSTGNLPGGATQFYAIGEFRNEIYACIVYTGPTTGLFKYNNATDTWGSVLQVTNVCEDVATGNVGGTAYIIFLSSVDDVWHSTDGATWTQQTGWTSPQACAIWDDKLWVMCRVGGSSYEVYYSTSITATPVAAGKLPVSWSSSSFGRLFVGRDAAGEEVLFASTSEGLFVHDFDNNKWIPTSFARKSSGGTDNAVRLYNSIYLANNSSIWKYGTEIVRIGPDTRDGLANTLGRRVGLLEAGVNDLFAAVGGTGSDGLKPAILAWNGQAWRVLYEGAANEIIGGGSRKGLLFSFAYSEYRLWFPSDTGDYVKYIKLPSDLASPLSISGYTYAAAATHDWPWFTAGQSEVTKVGVRLKVETLNPTTSETVKVYYAIDQSATFQILTNSTYTNGTITAAGVHTFDFPSVDSWVSTTAKTGTAFRSIRFRVVFARGGTTTNTPQVLSLTLEYFKKLDPKYQFQVTLDLTKDYKNNTVKGMRAALLTAMETATLVEFTYRDPSSNSDATFYVQVRPQASTEFSGNDERGTTQLLLVEV